MTDHVEAPSTRPEFVIPVRPTGVPPGLCELRPDIHVVGIEPHGAHYTTAAKLAGYILETIERQAAGRFYLWEAAQILAETHEKSPQGIKNAMRKAFSLGVLRVRMTDSDAPMDSDSRLRVEGMDSYVTPGDLNKWLETDGYPYRFPAAPEPASTPIEEAAAPIPAPSASAPAVASPEPVAAPAEAVPDADRPPTVQQAIAPYVAKLMRERPGYTAEDLYQRMKRDAGNDGSPLFRQDGKLFCMETGKPCGIKTVSAALTGYRKTNRKRRSSTVEAVEAP